jgi:uridine kinase
MKRNTLIGITGRSCSGKSTLAEKLNAKVENSTHFDIDDYIINASRFNYDSPSELEFEAVQTLSYNFKKLKEATNIELPIFDFKRRAKLEDTLKIAPAKFIIAEGTISFWHEDIRNLMDLKVFIDVPNKVCLKRRVDRSIKYYLEDKTVENIKETEERIKKKWEKMKYNWDNHLEPLKKYADLVIPHPLDGTERVMSYLHENNYINNIR